MNAFAPNGDGGISWAKNKTWLQMVLIVTAHSPKQFDSGTLVSYKTHTAEGWRQSRRAHTGVPLAGKKLARVPSTSERSISKFVI